MNQKSGFSRCVRCFEFNSHTQGVSVGSHDLTAYFSVKLLKNQVTFQASLTACVFLFPPLTCATSCQNSSELLPQGFGCLTIKQDSCPNLLGICTLFSYKKRGFIPVPNNLAPCQAHKPFIHCGCCSA